MNGLLQRIQAWAKALKRQVMVLWFGCRHPRTPSLPKLLAVVVVAYALSPIDLIPDFIPLLGYLDDVILLPLGIWLVIRLIPADVLLECRQQALEREREQAARPVSRLAGAVIILIWLIVAGLCGYLLSKHWLGSSSPV